MLQNLCFYSSISYVNHGNFVQKDLQGNVYSKIIIKVFIGYYSIDHLICLNNAGNFLKDFPSL